MFTGSLNRDVLRVIAEYARVSKATDVWVGCSGNFSIERNRGQLADVLIEEDATKHAIPLSVPLGTNRLSAKDARTLAMAVKKVMRETELKEPIQVLMKWAREANGV